MGLLGRKSKKKDSSSANTSHKPSSQQLLDPINHPTPDAPPQPPPPPSIQREHYHNHNNTNPSYSTTKGYLYAVQEYHNTIPSSSSNSLDDHGQNWTAAMKFTTSSEAGTNAGTHASGGGNGSTSGPTTTKLPPPTVTTPQTTPPQTKSSSSRPKNCSFRDSSTASSPGALEGSSVSSVVSNANFLYPSSSADGHGGAGVGGGAGSDSSQDEHQPDFVYSGTTPRSHRGNGNGGGGGGTSHSTPSSHHTTTGSTYNVPSHNLGIHYPQYPGSPARSRHFQNHHGSTSTTSTTMEEPEMVDDTYEEIYGDAYIAAPIRYIYPHGYGSMEPKSRPWQISLVVCVGMSFLTVFIVGHCADQFDESGYYYYQGDEITDDVIFKTRWCGSKPLYFTWILSVLITGFSCAYCSIIGYIKARDFAVANGRSQPPGMVGKSDYYVSVEDVEAVPNMSSSSSSERRWRSRGTTSGSGGGGGTRVYPRTSGAGTASGGRRKTLYQADGTPRYLGKHIYKPTQAAIHLTSR